MLSMPSCIISTETIGSAKAKIFISGFKQKTGLFACLFSLKNLKQDLGARSPACTPFPKGEKVF